MEYPPDGLVWDEKPTYAETIDTAEADVKIAA